MLVADFNVIIKVLIKSYTLVYVIVVLFVGPRHVVLWTIHEVFVLWHESTAVTWTKESLRCVSWPFANCVDGDTGHSVEGAAGDNG